MEELPKAGFTEIELRTMNGDVFHGGQNPRWLWLVARKGGGPGSHSL